MKNIPKPRGTYADYKSGKTEDKIFVFQLSKVNSLKNVRAKDTNAPINYPLSYPVQMVGTVYDSVAKAPRKIRFVDGEKSIFVDEQTPDDKFPKTKVMANFINGKIYIDGRDTVKLKFFMEWDINGTKEGRDEKKRAIFNLVDTSKAISAAKTKDKAKFAVAQWCYDAPLDKVLAVAATRLNSEQMVQSSDDIRFNLKLIADRNPEEFLQMLEDPKTERRYFLRKAIDGNIIMVNAGINGICYTDNQNAPLTVAPAGKDPLEDFISKSFSGTGEQYYNSIVRLVTPGDSVEEELVATPKANVIPKPLIPTGPDNNELKVLMNSGIDAELIIISQNRWYKYKGVNFDGEQKFLDELAKNEVMRELLKKELLEIAK